jgi:quinol monooxygenase YgiN
MTDAVAFISHFRMKPGKLEEVRALFGAMASQLSEAKPRTSAYLAFADDAGERLTILHLFPDADAMDAHFGGAEERSQGAYELFTPTGWEIYRNASPAALAQMEREAAEAGVPLTVLPLSVGGFLRPTS